MIDASKGEVVFVEDEHIDIEVGQDGLEGLLAYTGQDPDIGLLMQLSDQAAVATGDVLRASQQQPPGRVHKQSEAQT